MLGHRTAVRRRYVLWPRIDQKTCLKAVVSAGLEAVPLALEPAGDELRTDVAALEAELMRLGPAQRRGRGDHHLVLCAACGGRHRGGAPQHHWLCGSVRVGGAACLRSRELAAVPQASFCCERVPHWLCIAVTALHSIFDMFLLSCECPLRTRAECDIECAVQSCNRVLQVARLCEAHDVGHVINNAYGVQSTALCKLARPCSILCLCTPRRSSSACCGNVP